MPRGHNVKLDILSVVCGRSGETIEGLLSVPIKDGLLIKKQDHIFFVHDKIQQACYQLNEEKALPGLHFHIAGILIQHGMLNTLEELFSVTSHLTKGFSCIAADAAGHAGGPGNHESWYMQNGISPSDHGVNRTTYVEIYHLAALRSKEIAAYSEGLDFIRRAMELADDSVSKELRFKCAREYHIALHLNGFYEEADDFFEKEIVTCPDVFAIKDNCICKVSQDSMLGKYLDAAEFGLSILRQRGIDISLNPTHGDLVKDLQVVYREFENNNIKSIFDLKKISKKRSGGDEIYHGIDPGHCAGLIFL